MFREAVIWILFMNVSSCIQLFLCVCNEQIGVCYQRNTFPFFYFFLHVCCHGKCQTAHVMLTSRGANLFAESIGVVAVPPDTLLTEYEKKEWEKHKTYVTGVDEDFNTRW